MQSDVMPDFTGFRLSMDNLFAFCKHLDTPLVVVVADGGWRGGTKSLRFSTSQKK